MLREIFHPLRAASVLARLARLAALAAAANVLLDALTRLIVG